MWSIRHVVYENGYGIEEDDLFCRLAELYQLGALVNGSRFRNRERPPMILLEATSGRKVIAKEENSDWRPVEAMWQRDAILRQRLYKLRAPIPAPVLTADGSHGSVQVHDPFWGEQFLYFHADEFVEGTPLLDSQVDGETARRALQTAGHLGGLFRVISQDTGPHDCFHLGEQKLQHYVRLAEHKDVGWARQLRVAMPAILRVRNEIGLDAGGRSYVPMDCKPKDFMLARTGEIVWTDTEFFKLDEGGQPVRYGAEQWYEWAAIHGITQVEAKGLMHQAYATVLEQHNFQERARIDPDSPIGKRYLQMWDDLHTALDDVRLLPGMVEDARQRVPRHLEMILSASNEIAAREHRHSSSRHEL